MSIIIRLQNLPLSAKSADVRKFFGGLRIPDGGVHILGGVEGDAFIAFNTDEDARVAMRKDGERIKDSHVKLYLSSHMEMQHEVEKITKGCISELPSQDPFSQLKASSDFSKPSSSERRRHSRSQSPYSYDKWNDDTRRKLNQNRQRSRSPIDYDSSHRSHSPSRRPRSFQPSQSPAKSSKARSTSNYFDRKRPVSPKVSNYMHSFDEQNTEKEREAFPYDLKQNKEISSTSEIQAELERRITEAIERNAAMMSEEGFQHIPGLDMTHDPKLQGGVEAFPEQNTSRGVLQHGMNFSLPPPFIGNNFQQFPGPEFMHHHMVDNNQQQGIPPIIPHIDMGRPYGSIEGQRIPNAFYITMSGLNPHWTFREVQIILNGIYAPENNIRFEFDNAGFKTGTAFIKLINGDDFQNILNRATILFNGCRITISECPEFVHASYFNDSTFQSKPIGQQKRDFCYVLKGLPFACTYDDVINFFQGFEVADVVVFYGKDNKATGTGFVSFTNQRDFEMAIVQDGKKIGHRYIEMLPATEREMFEAKRQHPSAHNFKSYRKILSEKRILSSTRSLSAIVTGLPVISSCKALLTFFENSGFKPTAIHITLQKVNGKPKCDGRAFIEFNNFRDFDLALKLHGNSFKGNIICVKQILYDEMLKILDTQKAKHYFETSEPIVSALHVPEKVPYLWEPPDDTESEKDNLNITNNSWLEDEYLYSNNCENNAMQRNFKPVMLPNAVNRKEINHIPAVKTVLFKNKYNNYSPRQLIHIKTETESEIKAKNVDKDSNREPIKFNVNKQIISTKIADSFEPTKNAEEKLKLSKLSPDKESRHISVKKDLKTALSKTKSTEFKHKSLEKKEIVTERNFYKGRKDQKEDKYCLASKPASRVDSFSKNHFGNEFRRGYERKPDFYRNPPPNLLHSERDTWVEDRSPECIVQLSNVSPAVKNYDFAAFLKGFAYYEDSVTRRYSNETPTYDVRVTFINRREAELAVRTLAGRRLTGLKVDMCII